MDSRWGFFTVDLELTNICDQNCSFCPRSAITRPSGCMPLPLLTLLLPQLKEIGSRVTLCGMGCPLLHPDFEKISELFKSSGLKYGITVQSPALNDDNIKKITALEPSFIEVSFPSVVPEHFARIYPGENMMECEKNLMKLADMRKSKRGICVSAVLTSDAPDNENTIIEYWTNKGFAARVFDCHSRGGNLKNNVKSKPRTVEKCGLFASHAFITWDGRLLSCCHDLTGKSQIADLSRIPLIEAGTLKAQITGSGKMPFEMCDHCDEAAANRAIPDRDYPASDKARSRFLAKLTHS